MALTTSITLDEEVVHKAVAKALVDNLGEDGQRTLVEAALQYLITPQKATTYSREEPSVLQNAFNRAVGSAAQKLVDEIVAENEEFKAKIRVQVGEAFIKMESTNFTDYLGTALSDALKKS